MFFLNISNSYFSDEIKSSIQNCLHEMNITELGIEKLEEFNFNIERFILNNTEEYVKSALEYEKVSSKLINAYY